MGGDNLYKTLLANILVAFSMPYLSIVIFILNIVKHRSHVCVIMNIQEIIFNKLNFAIILIV